MPGVVMGKLTTPTEQRTFSLRVWKKPEWIACVGKNSKQLEKHCVRTRFYLPRRREEMRAEHIWNLF